MNKIDFDKTERLKRETVFHDKRFSQEKNRPNLYRYGLRNWYDKYFKLVLHVEKNVLEIGAGLESCFIEYPILKEKIVNSSIKVTSIDISPVAVEKCKELSYEGLRFLVQDAQTLDEIEDHSLYNIIGRGIIHHLNILDFTTMVKTKTKQDCRYIFAEPLVGPFYIRLYRFFTPNQRTIDEQPLRLKDLNLIEEAFIGPHYRKYYGFISIPFAFLGIGNKIIEKLDDIILNKLNLGSILAWSVILTNINKNIN